MPSLSESGSPMIQNILLISVVYYNNNQKTLRLKTLTKHKFKITSASIFQMNIQFIWCKASFKHNYKVCHFISTSHFNEYTCLTKGKSWVPRPHSEYRFFFTVLPILFNCVSNMSTSLESTVNVVELPTKIPWLCPQINSITCKFQVTTQT